MIEDNGAPYAQSLKEKLINRSFYRLRARLYWAHSAGPVFLPIFSLSVCQCIKIWFEFLIRIPVFPPVILSSISLHQDGSENLWYLRYLMLQRVTFCCHFSPPQCLTMQPFILTSSFIGLVDLLGGGKKINHRACRHIFRRVNACWLVREEPFIAPSPERCLSIWEGISYRRPTGSHYGVLFQRMANPRAALCSCPMRNIRGRARRRWLRMSSTSGGWGVLSVLYLFFHCSPLKTC